MSNVGVGQWTVKLNTRMGEQEGSLRIEEGDGGALSGNMSIAPLGDLELRDLKVDGSALTWSLKVRRPLPMTAKFAVTVDGDRMSGTMTSKVASGDLEGTRATDA